MVSTCNRRQREEQTTMGRIWMLGDNINTDVIIPGRYNVTTDRAQLAQYCLCEVLPAFAQQVQAGGVGMAGHNFCCGSVQQDSPTCVTPAPTPPVLSPMFSPHSY